MRGLMRLLMMFGPMIFQQYQKYQRNKQRNQGGLATPDTPRHSSDPRQQQTRSNWEGREQRSRNTPPPPPQKSQEQKDLELKEEDIMLDNRDLRHTDRNRVQETKPGEDIVLDDNPDLLEDIEQNTSSKAKKKSDLDLKDLFLD